jgi:Tc toxin complex TcA C-terminal TcB-binding domain/PKD domain/Putative peptidoglycan binding domain
MPIITTVFTPVIVVNPGTGVTTPPAPPLPAATIKLLHDELLTMGLPVAGVEVGATPQFGSATSEQLKIFQGRYKLPVTGNLDPTTGGILSLSALVATETDRTKLRTELASMVNNVPDSPQYNYWLARYALMSGDYTTANTARKTLELMHGVTFSVPAGLLINLGGIFDPGSQPRQPEIPFPENFYTYREDLVDPDQLAQLRAQLDSLTVEQYAAYISTPGNTVDPTTLDIRTKFDAFVSNARPALAAISAWQTGNHYAANREFSLAMQSYQQCQCFIADYFEAGDAPLSGDTGGERLQALLARRRAVVGGLTPFWSALRWRRILLSLQELEDNDRKRTTGNEGAFGSAVAFVVTFTARDEVWTNTAAQNQATRLDPIMLIIGTVWIPMAIGELNSQLRQYDAAIEGFTEILTAQTAVDVSFRYLCEFIEIPFIRLLIIETMLGKAEGQYKSRLSVDDEPDAAAKTQEIDRINQIAEEFVASNIPGDPTPGAQALQHLVAALTYADILETMKDDGEYVLRTKQALKTLNDHVASVVGGGDVSSMAFRSLGQTVTIPNVQGVGGALPGLTSGTSPHEAYLQFDLPDGPIRERNPRVYALLLQAQSRLLQIWSGFNYLGYRDDYVPPWRFQYLLDRARYFSEHAKNAQRDYLNFLNNAENEEFKEMSAGQNVELEKANVQIEVARVDQASNEVTASQESANLADLNAQDAQARLQNYRNFEDYADRILDLDGRRGLAENISDINSIVPGLGTGLAAVGDYLTGGFFARSQEDAVAAAQREVEEKNLFLAVTELQQSAVVAQSQLEVAKAGLVVAGLQRQAALLRHEFALQSLQFMRNQTLNTEQWYRLAAAIRSVSDIYLRYAIQTAFVAQQAYNFEGDKRLNVIRFDYDLSDVGAMLAADFLSRDLDTLEQDLVVSQQTRLQPTRYVLSLAREFPETLSDLAEMGEVMFSMRLEQLERHFPGLVNLRISSVDLLPVALMDPSRVSVELTHLGSGAVRLKSQPGTSPLNTSDLDPGDNWLPDTGTDWPIKVHVSGPETAVFTGLSRQDAASANAITANERGAFEGLPGASSWKIDMSAKENQIVPGTLADVLITFVLSGYYDADLKNAVTLAAASSRPFATTSYLSARRVLPDAYYSLVHYGRLDWEVSDRMLSLAGTPNELRNLAVVLALTPDGPEMGRCYCRYPVRIKVASGVVDVLTALPQFTMTPSGLTLSCDFIGLAGTRVTWDFGDGTPLAEGASVQHTYPRPGRYEVVTRLVNDQNLVEYRSAVVVSANHAVIAPLIVTPAFSAGALAADGMVPLAISAPGASDISIDCSAREVRGWAATGPITLKLKPGSYTLDFLATRKLAARFYSKQRYLPLPPLILSRGRISTNRTFDPATGSSTTISPNEFTTQLFGNGAVVVSPVDRWTLELPLAENPCFLTVSASDVAEFDGNELSDAILTLEFVSNS